MFLIKKEFQETTGRNKHWAINKEQCHSGRIFFSTFSDE
jgi:hypothetical protein